MSEECRISEPRLPNATAPPYQLRPSAKGASHASPGREAWGKASMRSRGLKARSIGPASSCMRHLGTVPIGRTFGPPIHPVARSRALQPGLVWDAPLVLEMPKA